MRGVPERTCVTGDRENYAYIREMTMGYGRGQPGPGDGWQQGPVYPGRGSSGAPTKSGFFSGPLGKIAIAGAIALLTGGTAPWWWPHGSAASPDGGNQQGSINTTPIGPGDNGGGRTPSGDGSSTSQPATDGCTIVISNPFATITDSPNPVDTGGTKVPAGTYQVLETTQTTFAGQPLLWFKITAAGHTGWIQDDTILIESKSAQC
jgi:hypothetical protein